MRPWMYNMQSNFLNPRAASFRNAFRGRNMAAWPIKDSLGSPRWTRRWRPTTLTLRWLSSLIWMLIFTRRPRSSNIETTSRTMLILIKKSPQTEKCRLIVSRSPHMTFLKLRGSCNSKRRKKSRKIYLMSSAMIPSRNLSSKCLSRSRLTTTGWHRWIRTRKTS